jgi:hypothetical protein
MNDFEYYNFTVLLHGSHPRSVLAVLDERNRKEALFVEK